MNLLQRFQAWNAARPQRKAARAERRRLKDLKYFTKDSHHCIGMDLRFNPKDADFTFEERLKAEYGWNDEQVNLAIQEYYKFLAIAVRVDGPAVPPPVVDMVWKQHMLFGRHYVSGLCAKILYRFVHRKASVDPAVDREELAAAWARTLEAYSVTFGDPAASGWTEPTTAFAKVVKFPSSSVARAFLKEKRKSDDSSSSSSGFDPLMMYLYYTILIQPHYNGDTHQHVTKSGNDAAAVVSDPDLAADGTDSTFDSGDTDSGSNCSSCNSCSSCSSGSSCSS